MKWNGKSGSRRIDIGLVFVGKWRALLMRLGIGGSFLAPVLKTPPELTRGRLKESYHRNKECATPIG